MLHRVAVSASPTWWCQHLTTKLSTPYAKGEQWQFTMYVLPPNMACIYFGAFTSFSLYISHSTYLSTFFYSAGASALVVDCWERKITFIRFLHCLLPRRTIWLQKFKPRIGTISPQLLTVYRWLDGQKNEMPLYLFLLILLHTLV